MNRKYIALLAAGHLFTDLNQGALPAILPFLISARGLSYASAAGLVFAANIVSSIVQPIFGNFADRFSKPWVMPVGVLLAGLGLACAGVLENYWLLFAAVSVSGVGIAAFHPEAARLANKAAGQHTGTGIGVFAVGGNAGFALGPMVATSALLLVGLKGTLVLAVPAALMTLLLWLEASKMAEVRQSAAASRAQARAGTPLKEQWASFWRLTVAIFCRSVVLFGLNTFLPLYWLHVLNQSTVASGSALTIMLMSGAMGTLLGGRLADRFGCVRIVRLGFSAFVPLMVLFGFTTDVRLATALLIPVGLTLYLPFSPMVVLGQRYLPGRMGLASGVTLGLAVSVGGISTPLLGWLADSHGLPLVVRLLAWVPLLAVAAAFTLPEPARPALASAPQPSGEPSPAVR